MRVIASLLLVAIIAQGALAVTQVNFNKLRVEQTQSFFEKTSRGRAFKNMITLCNQFQYDYGPVIAYFQNLKLDLLAQKAQATDDYANQTVEHESNVARLETAIDGFQAAIESNTDRANYDEATLVELHNSLVGAQEQLAYDYSELYWAQDQLDELEAIYAYEVEQYQQADIVIDAAIAELTSAQAHFESAGFAEEAFFIQSKSKFVAFSQKLSESTNKLSAKHQLFIQPIVKMLAQLKASQSSVQAALNALEQLKAYFQQAVVDGTALYLQAKAYLQGVIDATSAQITELETTIIPGIQATIVAVETDLAIAIEAIAFNAESKANAEAELDGETIKYAAQTAYFEGVVARCDAEYNIANIALDEILKKVNSQ